MTAEHRGSELDLTGLMQDGLRELIELVSSSRVTELKIERGGAKLHIKSAPVGGAPTMDAQFAAAGAGSLLALVPDEPAEAPSGVPIISPIVGTFYSTPRPNAPPFVEPGDFVDAGQTVGIVEAMKILNEIESEVSGRITEILVGNGQAVEYGQPLMLVDVSAGAPG